jgi:hypothetical protein
MQELIFAAPWWLPLLLALIALALFWTGNQRQQKGMKIGGLAVLAVGVAVLLLSWFVETDLEQVDRRTRDLIAAVEARDWPAVRRPLAPNASLGVANVPRSVYRTGDEIASAAQTAADQFGLRTISIRSLDLEQADTVITVTMRAWSEQEATLDRPLPTRWQLQWQQTAEGWFIHHITLLEVGQEPADRLAPQLPAP